MRSPKSSRNDRPPPSRLARAAPWLFFFLSVACATPREPAREPQGPLAEVERPPGLAQLDQAVREQFEEVWRRLQQGEATGPAQGAAWGAVGQWFDVYSYPDSAARCYRNARLLDPEEPRWPYSLAVIAEQGGDLDAAQEGYERAAQLAPDVAAPRVRLGDLALKRQALDAADALYRQVLEREPDNPGALLGSARLALMRGDARAALEPLQTLERTQPTAVSVQYSLGLAWRQLGDEERAAEHLRRVPADNLDQIPLDRGEPWDEELWRLDRGARALTRRGVRAFRRGEHEAAAVLLGRAVAADPDGPEVRINYALALRETGYWRAAEEQLQEALSRAVEGSDIAGKAHLEMGRLLVARGRPAAAVEHFEATLGIDPRSPAAHVELGRLRHRQGRLAAALEHYAAVRSMEHPVAGTRFWHAALLSILDRPQEAVAALDEDLQQAPGERSLKLLLARLLSSAPRAVERDIPRARRLLAETQDSTDVLYAETTAMVAAAEGRFGEAIAWQQAAIETLAPVRPRTASHTARRRLVLYERDEPCRTPWEAREALVLKPVRAPMASPGGPG